MTAWRERAIILYRKAKEDEHVASVLADAPDTPLWAVGFHAQQAVEKYIKAVLCWREVEFPFTHDLEDLLGVVDEHGLSSPDYAEEISSLTPFGVAFRYTHLDALDASDVLRA